MVKVNILFSSLQIPLLYFKVVSPSFHASVVKLIVRAKRIKKYVFQFGLIVYKSIVYNY